MPSNCEHLGKLNVSLVLWVVIKVFYGSDENGYNQFECAIYVLGGISALHL